MPIIQKRRQYKLTGKKALITGGNSGIGLATARLFIAEGAQVAITVTIRRRSIRQSPNLDRACMATAQPSPLRKTASSSSRPWPEISRNSLGRWGEPEDVAKAALFLASDDSSYVNAVELMVDVEMTGAPFGAPILRG